MRILKVLFLFSIATLFVGNIKAVDIVYLKNGGSIRGEVYQKDEDGSLFLQLPDKSKRYILVKDIINIEWNVEQNDTVPEDSYTLEINNHELIDSILENEKIANHLSVGTRFAIYGSGACQIPTKIRMGVERFPVYKAAPQLSIGSSATIMFDSLLVVMPALELSLSWNRLKRKDLYYRGASELSLMIPLEFGVMFNLKSNSSFVLHTGPIFDVRILDRGTDGHVRTGKDGGFIMKDPLLYVFSRPVFDLCWRVGLNFVIQNKVLVDISYSCVVSDYITNSEYYDPYYEKGGEVSGSMFMGWPSISIGYVF